MTRFILVRHGQTEWNRVERFRGQADVPLNDVGRAQALATGRRVAAQWPVTALYSSPLGRAVDTAQAIADHFNLPVQPHPAFTDIHFGAIQGLSVTEALPQWRDVLTAWQNAPHTVCFPGGESLAQLRERALPALVELALEHPNGVVVIAGHTVINRVILLGVLGLGLERFWRLGQDNCAINVFDAVEGNYTILTLNDTCHLH